MHQHIAHGDKPDTCVGSNRCTMCKMRGIIPVISRHDAHKHVITAKGGLQSLCHGKGLGSARDNQHAIIAPLQDIIQRQLAFAFDGTAFSRRQQAAEVTVAFPGFRICAYFSPPCQNKADTNNVADPVLFCSRMCTYNSGKCVDICNCDPGKAQIPGANDQFFRMRGAGQESEIADDVQFGVTHGNRPATYQSGRFSPGYVNNHNLNPVVVCTRQ